MGDGTTLMGNTVSHVYNTPGTIRVTVEVSDGRGGLTTGETTITVKNVTGRWVGRVVCPANAIQCQAAGGQFPIAITATQTGTNISGTTQQQVPGFPADVCSFSGGTVANFRLVAFAPFQGCAVLSIFMGCVGELDASLDNFNAPNLPAGQGRCELVRQ
jgi:hypothetical protein